MTAAMQTCTQCGNVLFTGACLTCRRGRVELLPSTVASLQAWAA